MCFKREKCEILCKQRRRVASIPGSPQGFPSPGTCRHFTNHPPAGQVLRHTISRNILLRCENLLFNFSPLKGKKHTHNNPHPPTHYHLPCCSTGWETKPAPNRGIHKHCPLPCRVLKKPGVGAGAAHHLHRRPGHAGFSASAPSECLNPALSGRALQGAYKIALCSVRQLGQQCMPS